MVIYMELSVMEDFSEIVHYDDPNIPIYIKIGHLSAFPKQRALGHWHEDIEIMKALHGNFAYDVNGKSFVVKEGDAILVNSRQTHYGYSVHGEDCEFLCILFKPELLMVNRELSDKYVNTILQQYRISECYISSKKLEHQRILHLLDDFISLQEKSEPCYEFELLSKIYLLWANLFHLLQSDFLQNRQSSDLNVEAQKAMVGYIYKNYANKMTLADISRAGGVCRSKCCQIFKSYLGKTPIEFINAYRLQVSMRLLNDATYTITEIASICGFSSASYFTEVFFKTKGCTPRSYRRRQRQGNIS